MKRLFVLTLAVALSLGVAVWAANPQDVQVNWQTTNWIILYVPTTDHNVTLGTVDGSQYDPATDQWTPITDGSNHSVYVITNSAGGFTLSVSAHNAAGYNFADLSRFQISGGDLATWTGTLNNTQILSASNAGIGSATDINYQYIPSWDDGAGDYRVTVTYTATAQ